MGKKKPTGKKASENATGSVTQPKADGTGGSTPVVSEDSFEQFTRMIEARKKELAKLHRTLDMSDVIVCAILVGVEQLKAAIAAGK